LTRVRGGLDLAKYVFEIHGVDAHGKTVLRKTLRRHAVSAFFANLPSCLVGMEASNGAHFWAKALSELGHDVRLISPQFVTPYVKSNKNDRNDAEAICEAVGRPNMRFVPVKSAEQLAVQAVHRIRSRLVAVARNPKWRMRRKRSGKTWSRKRRMNSSGFNLRVLTFPSSR
jgi:transposase